jgi:hypothetical protein
VAAASAEWYLQGEFRPRLILPKPFRNILPTPCNVSDLRPFRSMISNINAAIGESQTAKRHPTARYTNNGHFEERRRCRDEQHDHDYGCLDTGSVCDIFAWQVLHGKLLLICGSGQWMRLTLMQTFTAGDKVEIWSADSLVHLGDNSGLSKRTLIWYVTLRFSPLHTYSNISQGVRLQTPHIQTEYGPPSYKT